tara:strand:- start:5474 stop:5887 length:414 start_codon:yes stop_codon:yes gene_type:complete
MASILKVDTLTGVTTAGSISVTGEGNSTTTNLQQGLAKAWLNQSQNNTINDSLNISGLTDNGVGDCTFVFAAVMANVNHSLLGVMNSGANAANIMIIHNTMATASGRCRFGNYAGSGNSFTPFDDNSVKNTTHGDLA